GRDQRSVDRVALGVGLVRRLREPLLDRALDVEAAVTPEARHLDALTEVDRLAPREDRSELGARELVEPGGARPLLAGAERRVEEALDDVAVLVVPIRRALRHADGVRRGDHGQAATGLDLRAEDAVRAEERLRRDRLE